MRRPSGRNCGLGVEALFCWVVSGTAGRLTGRVSCRGVCFAARESGSVGVSFPRESAGTGVGGLVLTDESSVESGGFVGTAGGGAGGFRALFKES